MASPPYHVGGPGRPTITVFVETVSDGETELTLTNLRRHRQQGAKTFGVWLPALADYVSRRRAGRRIEGSFSAPHRMSDRTDPATWSDEGEWLRFSVVGFDQQGRHAIVFVQRGSFEGDGGDGLFLMLERTGGQWRIARRHTVYVI